VIRIVCPPLLWIVLAGSLAAQQVSSGTRGARITQLIDALHKQTVAGGRKPLQPDVLAVPFYGAYGIVA